MRGPNSTIIERRQTWFAALNSPPALDCVASKSGSLTRCWCAFQSSSYATGTRHSWRDVDARRAAPHLLSHGRIVVWDFPVGCLGVVRTRCLLPSKSTQVGYMGPLQRRVLRNDWPHSAAPEFLLEWGHCTMPVSPLRPNGTPAAQGSAGSIDVPVKESGYLTRKVPFGEGPAASEGW